MGWRWTRSALRRAISATLVAVCAFLAPRAPALAQCAPSGTNQTCTNPVGTTLSGGTFGISDTATLTVTNLGTITGTNSGLIGGSVNATNAGTISSANSGINAFLGTANVVNSGTISAGGAFGIGAATTNLINSGTIAASAEAIFAPTAANVINSGTLSGGSFGIDTAAAVVVNSGAITGGTTGLFVSTTANVINTGTITGGSRFGIVASTTANVVNFGTISGGMTGVTSQTTNVTNTGTISGGSFGVTGITTTVVNSGTISGGIFGVNGTNTANVTNSGSISGGTAIFAIDPSTVTNSGVIVGTGGTAIDFSFSHADTLTFLPGSQIAGAILLGSGDSVRVITGAGPSALTTFTPNGPFTITAGGGAPFVLAGNQVASLDPTPFALADKVLMDFTRGVSAMLDAVVGGGGSSGPISSAFAPNDSIAALVDDAFGAIPALAYTADAMVFKSPTLVTSDGRAVWARGFGGERFQDADGFLLGSRTTYLGGAVGFDLMARPDLRLGLFVGGGESRLALDGNAGSTDTDTAFGGFYGRWGFTSFGHNSFLDFALHGGGSTNATSRTVLNNLAPGGIELATARYASAYLSPEIKYGVDLPLWPQYTLTPSLRVRYVAGFFGGYTEIGTAAPLTVASRTIHDFEERGELQLTRATPVGPDLLLTSVHIGAIGLERAGDTTVDTVLLGTSLPFVTPGKNDVAGVVGGAGFEWRTREGISFFSAAEAIGFSDQSTVWNARGGVRVAF